MQRDKVDSKTRTMLLDSIDDRNKQKSTIVASQIPVNSSN